MRGIFKKGDLVHLPSHTFLFDSNYRYSRYKQLNKPAVGIILEERRNHLKLAFENRVWFVAKKDAYPI